MSRGKRKVAKHEKANLRYKEEQELLASGWKRTGPRNKDHKKTEELRSDEAESRRSQYKITEAYYDVGRSELLVFYSGDRPEKILGKDVTAIGLADGQFFAYVPHVYTKVGKLHDRLGIDSRHVWAGNYAENGTGLLQMMTHDSDGSTYQKLLRKTNSPQDSLEEKAQDTPQATPNEQQDGITHVLYNKSPYREDMLVLGSRPLGSTILGKMVAVQGMLDGHHLAYIAFNLDVKPEHIPGDLGIDPARVRIGNFHNVYGQSLLEKAAMGSVDALRNALAYNPNEPQNEPHHPNRCLLITDDFEIDDPGPFRL